MVLQARLRFRHEGCISEHVTGSARVIHMSGDDHHCVAMFRADSAEQLQGLLDGSAALFETDGIVDRGDDWAVVRCSCPQNGSRVVPVITGMGCSVIWPVVAADGHETWNVLAPSRVRLRELVTRLEEQGDVTVERARDVPGPALAVHLPLAEITENMTPRQLQVLKVAVACGYYDSPRRLHAEDLAASMGMSRSTYQEHLQKAEAAVMKRFADLVLEHPVLEQQALKRPGRPKKLA